MFGCRNVTFRCGDKMEHDQEFYVYAIYVVADPIWWMDDSEWSRMIGCSTVRYALVRFNEWNQYINKKINNFASLWYSDEQNQLLTTGLVRKGLRHKWWRHLDWRNNYCKMCSMGVSGTLLRELFLKYNISNGNILLIRFLWLGWFHWFLN